MALLKRTQKPNQQHSLVFVFFLHCYYYCYYCFLHLKKPKKITNSTDSFANLKFRNYNFSLNIFNDLRKKKHFGSIRTLFSFSTAPTEKKFVEKISETNWWKHLMNSLKLTLVFKVRMKKIVKLVRKCIYRTCFTLALGCLSIIIIVIVIPSTYRNQNWKYVHFMRVKL